MNSKPKTCFVVSPIGRQGTDTYRKFDEVFRYMIRPAVISAGLNLDVVRADHIHHPGSFIKDILKHLHDSFVVIADLTGQNPNVFYELGVRHSLSPRTILIAQNSEDIPSDLKEYRYVVYEMSFSGQEKFSEQISKYLREIDAEPDRSDSPVLDRLRIPRASKGESQEDDNKKLRQEVKLLRRELAQIKAGRRRTDTVAAGRSPQNPLVAKITRALSHMTYSYKPVLLCSLWDNPRPEGYWTLEEASSLFLRFYTDRVDRHLDAEYGKSDLAAPYEVSPTKLMQIVWDGPVEHLRGDVFETEGRRSQDSRIRFSPAFLSLPPDLQELIVAEARRHIDRYFDV